MCKICSKPFKTIEIYNSGDVYTCCMDYINHNNIGNIFSENISLEEIWYSNKATELRKKILNQDYSMCNLDLCRQRILKKNKDNKYNLTPPLPQYITLAYDLECNLKCIFCRDEKIKNDEQTTKLYNEKIDTLLVPLIKEAKIVALSGSGEAFYSKHSRLLIKKLTKINPKIKFNINTNGLLFNKANCKALGLTNRINDVFLSIHALDEKLYNKIMVGSNLKVVLKNLKWMAEAQKKRQIKRVTVNTAICDINYKEIPKLLNLAINFGVGITFSQYYDWGTEFGKDYDKRAVWVKNHPEYNNFIKILQNKELDYHRCNMSPLFYALKNQCEET